MASDGGRARSPKGRAAICVAAAAGALAPWIVLGGAAPSASATTLHRSVTSAPVPSGPVERLAIPRTVDPLALPRAGHTGGPVTAAGAPLGASPPGFYDRGGSGTGASGVPVDTLAGGSSGGGGAGATGGAGGGGGSLTGSPAFQGTSLDGEINAWGIFHWPPDLQVAASTTDEVEAVNSSIWVYNRSGTQLGTFDSAAFFGAPTSPGPWYLSDPQVRFDPATGRWFATAMTFYPPNSGTGGQAYLAVSAGTDPTAAWKVYTLAQNLSGVVYDQPFLAVGEDKVLVSWNDYDNNFSTFTGQETRVIQKSDLVAGAANPRYVSLMGSTPDNTRFRLVPVQQFTPSTTANLVYDRGTSAGLIEVTGTPAAANVSFTETDLPISAMTFPPSADQPGLPSSIDTNDTRFLSAVSENTTVWVSANDACTPSGDTQTRPCLRLIELATSASPAVVQDFDAGVNGADLYYPAVTLDASGDLYVTFTKSSSTIYPSALLAVQAAGGSPGALTNLTTTAAGVATYDNNQNGCGGNGSPSRWGDYSGASSDPANPGGVWLAGMYSGTSSLSETNGCEWATKLVEASYVQTTAPEPFHALVPVRICDTRPVQSGVASNQCDTGGHGTLGPGGVLPVTVTGAASGIPSTATAAVLNVTVTDTTQAGYLTVYPAGSGRPLASNLNWVRGETIPNLVQIALGTGGAVSVYNAFGSADVLVDADGWYGPAAGTDGRFTPVAPYRVCDTRPAQSGVASNQCDTGGHGTIGPGGVLPVTATGGGSGIPTTGVEAVAINVTAVGPTAPAGGYLTIYPAGATRPTASNLNFTASETIANRVVVGINQTTGRVDIYNFSGYTNVIVDVDGWYTNTSASGGTLFTGRTPVRICDTRAGAGVFPNQCDVGGARTLGTGGTVTVSTTGLSGVPAGAVAVVCNVTATDTTATSYLTVYPAPASPPGTPPTASDLNWTAGGTVPNLVIVRLGSGGAITLYNASGNADVIVDLVGWYA